MVTRKKRDRNFKLEVLGQIEQRPLSEVCREYNIHPSSVHRWKVEYQQYPKEAFKGQGNIYKEDARIAQYERLLGQAHAEIAFLKKTLEFLQRRRAEEKMLRCTE